MNVQGLIFTLTSVSSVLSSPFYDTLLSDDRLMPNELQGTRQYAAQLVADLKATPTEKLEPLVAQYDDELTEQLNKFQGEWTADRYSGFRNAQAMFGLVASIFNRANIVA